MRGKISNSCQVGSIRRYTLTEGNGKGLDIIDCDNGNIRFLINVSRGLDIAQLYHQGQNVSFISKNGISNYDGDFLSRFEGGMLYTCGLDSVGGRQGYELHGSYHKRTANVVRAELTESEIIVVGEITCTALFGENLKVTRTISTSIRSDSVRITDIILNQGFSDQQYCMLYHVNIGYPMLDDGAKIVIKENSVKPRTKWAQDMLEQRLNITSPVANMEETCYFIDVEDGKATLINGKIKKSFTICWSKETLPYFVEWKSMAKGDYALGLEPSTTELDQGFKYSTLKSGESVTNKLQLSIKNI